jgi:hypothetical protein
VIVHLHCERPFRPTEVFRTFRHLEWKQSYAVLGVHLGRQHQGPGPHTRHRGLSSGDLDCGAAFCALRKPAFNGFGTRVVTCSVPEIDDATFDQPVSAVRCASRGAYSRSVLGDRSSETTETPTPSWIDMAMYTYTTLSSTIPRQRVLAQPPACSRGASRQTSRAYQYPNATGNWERLRAYDRVMLMVHAHAHELISAEALCWGVEVGNQGEQVNTVEENLVRRPWVVEVLDARQ